MPLIFILLILVAVCVFVAVATAALGAWSSYKTQTDAQPAALVRHDEETVTRGDPTPTNK
jgi:hypothetical protein